MVRVACSGVGLRSVKLPTLVLKHLLGQAGQLKDGKGGKGKSGKGEGKGKGQDGKG